MKSIKTIIGALLLTLGAIGIASCSQEEDNTVMQEKGNLLKIRTTVADTRGVITGTTFQKGDEIGICVTTIDGHDYTGNSQNIRATYTGSDWQLERDVELTDDEAIVYAYYPYSADATDSIDIDLNPTTTSEQTDYLQGSCQGVSINNTTANIQFNHVLTRLTLAITKGVNDVGEGVISRVRIENNHTVLVMNPSGTLVPYYADVLGTEGKMCIKTGGVRKIASMGAHSVELPVDCTINTSTAQYIDFLVFPYEDDSELGKLVDGVETFITIDGSEYSFMLDGQPTWIVGQQYTYPITIERNTVPTPEPIVGEAVYMGFDGDDGQPLYWATYNLGATSPEQEGGFYGWGDPTGEQTLYWNWTLEADETYDEHLQKVTICVEKCYGGSSAPDNISGTELDVVRALRGDNWRMPSDTECAKLIENCDRVEVEEEVDGVLWQGYWFTSKVNGYRIFIPISS